MQKALRRTYATHAGKHHRRKPSKPPKPPAVKELAKARFIYRFGQTVQRRAEINALADARRNRREDWELGPLRPWRAASDAYGTFPPYRTDFPTVPEQDRIRDWFFREGDRVCVVKGSPHVLGKIGVIEKVDKEKEVVTIDGVNLVDIRVPERVRSAQGEGTPAFNTVPEPVPVKNVRLVYPLQDPETGEYRDCILTHLEKRNARRDPFRSYNPDEQLIFDRYLVPHNLRIPWPKEEEPVGKNEKGDTLLGEVEEVSFLPTLLRPPMPEEAMQELRSRDKMLDGTLRARFDVGNLEKMAAEAEREDTLHEARLEAMPHGAKNVARKGSSAGGTFMRNTELPQFDSETLRIIGSHLARKKQEKEAAQLEQSTQL